NQLIEHQQTTKAQIIIPLFRGFRGNPVLLDRSMFPEMRELADDVGCRALFGGHTENIHKLEVDDPGILEDIDSRDDYAKLSDAQGQSAERLPTLESRDGVRAEAPELVIVGRDAMVFALVKLGSLMKFTVTVVDPFLRLTELAGADRMLHALDFSMLPAS